MLAYHVAIVDRLTCSNASLAVLGCGLGAHQVLLELTHRILSGAGGCDGRHAARLVLLIGTPQEEAENLLRLAHSTERWTSSCRRLVLLGSDIGAEERAEQFALGGVFVASAKVLVPDLLSGRLVAESLDGVLLNNAHAVGELSAEAFVLRMFRSKNRKGFVRAVSDRPDKFGRNCGQIEKVLQRCFVQHLEVWPRIRQEVRQSLEGPSQPDVLQKTLQLPMAEKEIQRRITRAVEGSLEELLRNQSFDLNHLVSKDALSKSFETELRIALDPVWHTLGPRSRRVVSDMCGLRKLALALLRYGAVEFLNLLETLGDAGRHGDDVSAWLFSEDAQRLFELARARVYEVAGNGQGQEPRLIRKFVPHAKWQVVCEIISQTMEEVASASKSRSTLHSRRSEQKREVRADIHTNVLAGEDIGSDIEIIAVKQSKRPRSEAPVLLGLDALGAESQNAQLSLDSGGLGLGESCSGDSEVAIIEPRLLVVVADDEAKRLLSGFLHRGVQATLLDGLLAYMKERTSMSFSKRSGGSFGHSALSHANQGGLGNLGGVGAVRRFPDLSLLSREVESITSELKDLTPQGILQIHQLPDGRFCQPRVDVVSLEGPLGSLATHLREVQPHAVVLCEPALEAIRTLEVFCAEFSSSSPRTNFNNQEPCTAEVGNESASRVTKHLSPLKAYLLVFEESVEKSRFHQSLVREGEAVAALIRARSQYILKIDDGLGILAVGASTSSRCGGGRAGVQTLESMIEQRIVVDAREFRSALPFMLYLRGLVVEPLTITVGDYVLSRDICVERKSIPDLAQSLASGRLYQQAQNLCNLYMSPCLLIEFDPEKSFSLINSYTLARREVETGARDLLSKIALLVLHFPKLRIIWSPSQRFTADIFLKLKVGRHQPDAQTAARIGASDDVDESNLAASEQCGSGVDSRNKRLNSAAFEVLRKLPGVTHKNMHAIARRGGCLAGVARLTEDELADVMGKANAHQLHDFLHQQVGATVGLDVENDVCGHV